jgi:glutamate/tyrosine decarboxylase-like PLP-dependent enzyme
MTGPKLRNKMLRDQERKEIFKQALEHGFSYMNGIGGRPVYPDREAVADLEGFDQRLPTESGNAGEVIQMLHRLGSPATVAQTGGRYFGFVNGGVLPVSLAARLIADFWDQNSALSVMSPVVAKLETVTEGWLVDLLGLPQETVAGFVSGTSVSILCGLAAARYRIFQNLGWDINARGLNGAPGIRVVTGAHAHATVYKAVALLGLGVDNVETVGCDDQGRIIAEKIPALDSSTILILQAGNVSSGAFDPFDQIVDSANEAGAWVHIDGAFGLWAAGCERLCHLIAGIENCNSWSVDAHKTLNAPYDNGIVLCRDREALARALQATGSYITYGSNRDGMLYTPEMSRRARVVELWATLKYLGRAGVDDLVGGLHDRAMQAAAEFNDAGFRVLNDVVYNQVLVACESAEITDQTLKAVQASGECWAGGATWGENSAIRISVCSWATTVEDITRSVAAFKAARESAIISAK